MADVQFQVRLHDGNLERTSQWQGSSESTIREVLECILEKHELPYSEHWEVRFQGKARGRETPVGDLLDQRDTGNTTDLEVRLKAQGQDALAGIEAILKDKGELELEEQPLDGVSQDPTRDTEENGPAGLTRGPAPVKTHGVGADPAEDTDLRGTRAPAAAQKPARVRGVQPARKPVPIKVRSQVRYYRRMNPHQLFSLVIILSENLVRDVNQPDVDIGSTKPFETLLGSTVEVVPDIPGCICFPERAWVRIQENPVQRLFLIFPHLLGELKNCSVSLFQGDQLLAAVPLRRMEVRRRWPIWLTLVADVVLPLTFWIVNHSEMLKGVLAPLPPSAMWVLLGILAPLTAFVIYWYWPREDELQRVEPISPKAQFALAVREIQEGDREKGLRMLNNLLRSHPDFQPSWLFGAQWYFGLEKYERALKFYQVAFRLGSARSEHYYDAFQAAKESGEAQLQSWILEQARQKLGPRFAAFQQQLAKATSS